MIINKYVARLNEQQERLNSKKFYGTINDINTKLSKVHRSIATKVDIEKYKPATDYLNQYILHTDVWNLKFLMNLENPEIAMLQIFNLEFIFAVEKNAPLEEELATFEEQAKLFYSLGVYSEEHLEKRKQNMYWAIQEALENDKKSL